MCKVDQRVLMKQNIDIVSDSMLQITFNKGLHEVWCSIKEEHSQLNEKAIKILLSFPTRYLYEAKFSSFTSAKTLYQQRWNAEAGMTTHLSSIQSELKEICKGVKNVTLL